MRILFFSNVFPNPLQPTKGPFNRALIRALARDHEVRVVSPIGWLDEWRGRWKRGARAPFGCEQHDAGFTVEFARYWYPPGVLRAQYGQWLEWSTGKLLDRRLRECRTEAVVSYWVHPDGEVAVRAARRAGIPAIVMTGGSDVLLYGRSGRRRAKVLNVLRQADAVVAVSRNLADVLIEDGINPDRVHVISRGVDRSVFFPGDRDAARKKLGLAPDRHTLVAVGRLVPVKGFDVLIRTVHELCRYGVPVDCHILGGGELHETLSADIRRLGIADRVFLRGATKQSDLPDWYRAADLTVLSSHSEGIPNVLLESICCGTRFVATNVGGVSEIADTGLHQLVPHGDATALAMAIRESLDAADEGHRITVTPRFVPLSWEESAQRLCDVIGSCYGDPANNGRPADTAAKSLELAEVVP